MSASAGSTPGGLPFRAPRRFHVLAQVGQGGIGSVYEAIDRERDVRVALKTLRQPGAEAVLLLKNEFRALQDIDHPNLVTPKELFEHDGQWFFSMDLVRGVDFLSYVRPSGAAPRLPDEERLRAALGQIALGLSALHADHKVHRDVKPSNVLVDSEGRVRILDFGIVRDLTDRAQAGSEQEDEEDERLVGTVLYMAPEQALGTPVTPAADWYAFGVMLFQALTGALPFAGSMTEILGSKATRDGPAPSTRQEGLPADLDELARDLVRVEPRERPEGRDILRRLGVEPGSESRVRTRAGGFVGRHAELDAIRAAFADVAAGAPVSVFVSGESGVGKSRLVREFTQLAASDDRALLLRGRCYERESLAYKAVDSVVDELSRHLARLPPDELAAILPDGVGALRTLFKVLEVVPAIAEARLSTFEVLNPQEARARLFAILRALLANLARRRRVVLVIDDLQWADADSLALLADVLRPPDAPPFFLLASIRREAGGARSSDVVARLSQLPGDVRWLHLSALEEAEARDLIRALLDRATGAGEADAIDAIYREARGHPLFIDELVRHRAAHADTAGARLDDALWDRAKGLPPRALRLLEALAVAGVPVPQHIVASAAALDAGQAFDALGALRAGHFVRTSGVGRQDTVEAYHDRVRESVLGHLEPVERKAWHGRLAVAFEEGGNPDPETLVTHWIGAGENGRAAVAAESAAERAAASFAFDHAASLYATAIELGAPAGEAAVALKEKLAQTLTNAARGGDAAAAYLEAAGDGTSIKALDLRRRAAEQLLCSGRIEEGTRVFEEVLRAAGVRMPRSRGAIVLSLLGSTLWLAVRGLGFKARRAEDIDPRALFRLDCIASAGPGLGTTDHVRGRELQVRALALALRVGEPWRFGRALAYYAFAIAAAGPSIFDRAMELQRRVGSLAGELGGPYLEAMTHGVKAFALYLSGEIARSREPFVRAETIFRERCVGVPYEIATTRFMLCRGLAITGDLPALERALAPTLREVEQRGDLYSVVNLRSNCLWLLALARDDVAVAERDLDDVESHLPKGGMHLQHVYWLMGKAHVRLYAGDAARARGLLAASARDMKRALVLHVYSARIAVFDLRARACLAVAASGGAEAAVARREAERIVRQLERESSAWVRAYVAVHRGCMAAIDGARDRAAARFAEAERGFDGLQIVLAGAAARRARGLVVEGDEGRELVGSADERMETLGVKSPARMARMFAPGVDASVRARTGTPAS